MVGAARGPGRSHIGESVSIEGLACVPLVSRPVRWNNMHSPPVKLSETLKFKGEHYKYGVRGALCVVRGAWRVVRGALRVVRGPWRVVRGPWRKAGPFAIHLCGTFLGSRHKRNASEPLCAYGFPSVVPIRCPDKRNCFRILVYFPLFFLTFILFRRTRRRHKVGRVASPKSLREHPLTQLHFPSLNAKLRAPRRALTIPISGPGRISWTCVHRAVVPKSAQNAHEKQTPKKWVPVLFERANPRNGMV